MPLRSRIVRPLVIRTLIVAVGLAIVPAGAALAQRAPEDRDEIRLSFAPIVKRSAPAVVNVYATQMRRETRSPFGDDPFFERFFGQPPFDPRGDGLREFEPLL